MRCAQLADHSKFGSPDTRITESAMQRIIGNTSTIFRRTLFALICPILPKGIAIVQHQANFNWTPYLSG